MPNTKTPTSEIEFSNNGIEKKVAQASAAAHSAIDKVADVAHPAVDTIVNKAHAVVDDTAQGATRAAATASVKGAQLKGLQDDLAEQLRTYVREKPLTAIGIAVGATLIARRLLGL